MSRLVILVDFRVRPADHDRFSRLITENAAESVRNEPGCRQFDVLVPEGGAGGQFILYEIYDDQAAFDAHLRSDHFKKFDAATTGMITERTITRLNFAAP
jgi:quinol monooxygenase YgiN